MARAYGWNAQLLIAEENEYGVPPEENYWKIPFISSSLDSEQILYHPMFWDWDATRHSLFRMLSTWTEIWPSRWICAILAFG